MKATDSLTASMTDGSIRWSEPVRRAIAQRDTMTAGMELLRMDVGLSLVPILDKKPISHLADRTGDRARKRPETNDAIIWRDWLALYPDAGMAIVPGMDFVVIDDDVGTLDAAGLGLAGTYADRTRRGTHYWLRLPEGRRGRTAKLPDGGGEILTGSSYVVSAPTEGYHPKELEAPILMPSEDSPLWDLIRPRHTSETYAILRFSEMDERQARWALERLRTGMFAKDVAALFTDEWRTRWSGWTESERDAALVFYGSHFLRDQPRAPFILAALLWSTGWPTDRYRKHPKHNPAQYVAITVSHALAERANRDHARIADLALLVGQPHAPTPTTPDTPASTPTTVIDGTPPSRDALIEQVVAFAEITDSDEYARHAGWRRLPVNDLAALNRTQRKNVYRAIVAAEKQGLIERQPVDTRHDGRPRKDSLIRPVRAGRPPA